MIVWKICKIVLLVLACLVALVLLLLLIVLLGAIRYELHAESKPAEEEARKTAANGWFSYLLPLFRERFSFEDGKFSAKDYVLLIPLRKTVVESIKARQEKKEARAEKKAHKVTVNSVKEPVETEETSQVGFQGFGPHKKESFFDKAKKKADDIKAKISDIVHKISTGAEKVSDYADALDVLFPYIKKALQIVLPKRFAVSADFGFEDPSVTGQVLGLACVLAEAICDGKKRVLTLTPDFEKEVFAADGTLKGRFCLLSLLCLGIRVVLDKDARAVLKRI